MNMKKISAILVAAAVSVTLFAGCGSNNAGNTTNENNKKVENKDNNTTEENNSKENNSTEDNKDEAELKDGTYKAEVKEADEHGWKSFAEVTVKDGKIEAVNFDYANAEGALKTEDEEYNKQMKDVSGASVAEAAEQLATQLVEKQNIEEVEVVTGATSSTEDFKKLVSAALEAAKEGKTETVVVE